MNGGLVGIPQSRTVAGYEKAGRPSLFVKDRDRRRQTVKSGLAHSVLSSTTRTWTRHWILQYTRAIKLKRSHYVALPPRNLPTDRPRDRSHCGSAERRLDAFKRWPAWAMGCDGYCRHDRSRDAVADQPFASADMRQDGRWRQARDHGHSIGRVAGDGAGVEHPRQAAAGAVAGAEARERGSLLDSNCNPRVVM